MKKNPKKKQIVEAAARIIAEKGYESASIKEIATEAGLTAPGLIHYYFKSKEEILREVMRESRERYEEEFENPSLRPSSDLFGSEEYQAHVTERRDPDWYKLRYELFAQGLRDPALSHDVYQLLEVGREGIADVLDSTLIHLSEEERESLSAILLACFDGLALQKLLRPELDLEKTYALLETMIVDRFSPSK
ncbi:TetR/AcrR family transcriptional regulator [Saccharibacillus sp. JS10]|uniref:TetR/AcrR family transcriptional regulator n=1 Tax=Saccharibacillus sp. JS10 TaxID=2950552 RepID=UPI002109EA8B|nr:TetR/AcrR family transcriptional regulator [Saccharibacillus sp. JS10]MCQ4087993.1 TetR/AcrR family transcriptional regulator [Saccharibacillus sp. JS10]